MVIKKKKYYQKKKNKWNWKCNKLQAPVFWLSTIVKKLQKRAKVASASSPYFTAHMDPIFYYLPISFPILDTGNGFLVHLFTRPLLHICTLPSAARFPTLFLVLIQENKKKPVSNFRFSFEISHDLICLLGAYWVFSRCPFCVLSSLLWLQDLDSV